MTAYIALIHKDQDSDFGVSFPDFPGCYSAGSTLDEALMLYRKAASLGHTQAKAAADRLEKELD